jgi:hypothetical protein
MHAKGGSPVAFIEYGDLKCASQAMAALQGSFLISSDRGAMRIEYAKTKMAEVSIFSLRIILDFIKNSHTRAKKKSISIHCV